MKRKDEAKKRKPRLRTSWTKENARFSNRMFYRLFRMHRACFVHLCEKIERSVGEKEFKSEKYIAQLLLSGLGAMTAILLLIFKDTILSLVASVQLTAQDMVRVGDWIEMSQFGADGDVVDVQLHTVKVQNFDKTITTIPTHRLITDSFKNWRGMSQTGARRIKRAIFVDVSSIRFQTQDEVDHFTRFALLKDYIANKEQELTDYNEGLNAEVDAEVNRRRLTNFGTFRAYAYNYLKNHPKIHQGMTLIVRQLGPGPEGSPLEIYCFTNTTEWNAYEDIQSDIFDHLLAIVPEFGLRLYQKPAGSDLANLK
jgi:miniconductance mechanosensitive channel